MVDELIPIQAALDAGDRAGARRLLRPLLDSQAPAELWYLAAQAAEAPEQQRICLKRALKADPAHNAAEAFLRELDSQVILDTHIRPPADLLPSLEALTALPESTEVGAESADQPSQPTKAPTPSLLPVERHLEVYQLRQVSRQRRRRRLTVLGCGASLLMSLSLGYFVMMLLGSPVITQVRTLMTGYRPPQGTPIFGAPDGSGSDAAGGAATTPYTVGDPNTAPAGGALDFDDPQATVVYTAAGSFVVRPAKSVLLASGQPISDVMEDGFAHEYAFEARYGQEVAVAIQFFSPAAQAVSKNVAVLDPSGWNAGQRCERDAIIQGDNGAAFICTIDEPGTWRLQVFGRTDESVGVYVVTLAVMG